MLLQKTDRLIIRTWSEEDILAIKPIYQDQETMKLVIGGPLDYEETKDAVHRYMKMQEEKGYTVWPVTYKDNGKIIGHAGLDEFEGEEGVFLNVLLDKKYWGKGLGEEAMQTVINYAFGELDLENIRAMAKPANVHFTRILEELNMKHQHEGMYKDTFVTYYKLKKEDVKWEKIFKYLK